MSDPKFPQVNNPKLWPDPERIRFKELYKYISLDELKIGTSLRNYRGSLPMLGGIFIGCLLAKGFAEFHAEHYIFGENGNGGRLLTLISTNTQEDLDYNREFQRMRWLTEDPAGDDPHINTSPQLLEDLGVHIKNYGNNLQANKRAPHYKYF
eukprot:TRINITY_DN0_c817_g1_i5.p1 TRINITY_DN0_c817_g1~~TRINITY_DN0_c817_g1_i5.p1  ORF type:complete len:152 (+),score=49.26 TRINITY_DN0_c817_g1_i5:56-511(+)